MQVIQTSKPNKVIYSWSNHLDANALEQAKSLAEQPFTFKHMALMSDAHLGTVAPIGTVLAAKNVILPYCIGSDCGCGIVAVKTSLKVSDFREGQKEELLHSMERSTPVGFQHNDEKKQRELIEKYNDKIEYIFYKNKIDNFSMETRIFKDLRKDVAAQLSTLGGG